MPYCATNRFYNADENFLDYPIQVAVLDFCRRNNVLLDGSDPEFEEFLENMFEALGHVDEFFLNF